MNCDRIAASYRWFEYAAFGRRLQRHRLHYLSLVQKSRRALLLGDGDGRFLTQLALRNSALEIDSIEVSQKMTELSDRRLKRNQVPNPGRIRFFCDDARLANFPPCHYDLVVTNFFLDCFTDQQVYAFADTVAMHLTPGAFWLVSEFRKPSGGWRAAHAEAWLRTMYLFFRLSAQLQTKQLPNSREILAGRGFRLQSEYSSMAGFVVSELWQFGDLN